MIKFLDIPSTTKVVIFIPSLTFTYQHNEEQRRCVSQNKMVVFYNL